MTHSITLLWELVLHFANKFSTLIGRIKGGEVMLPSGCHCIATSCKTPNGVFVRLFLEFNHQISLCGIWCDVTQAGSALYGWRYLKVDTVLGCCCACCHRSAKESGNRNHTGFNGSASERRLLTTKWLAGCWRLLQGIWALASSGCHTHTHTLIRS